MRPDLERKKLKILIQQFNGGIDNLNEIIKQADKVLEHGIPDDDPQLKAFFEEYTKKRWKA